MEAIVIHLPTTTFPSAASAPAYSVDRGLPGLRVGLRHDGLWQSWRRIIDIWRLRLELAGGVPIVLQVGEHTGHDAASTNAELLSWIEAVDCAVVGVGT